jgi:hypothetical protein
MVRCDSKYKEDEVNKINPKITIVSGRSPHWSRLVSVLFRTCRPLFAGYFKQTISLTLS